MAVVKWASTGLGWGGGLSRLRTPSAAPWDGDSTQKLPPAAYSTASQPLPPPQGLYYGHIAPPPTGSRAGARTS